MAWYNFVLLSLLLVLKRFFKSHHQGVSYTEYLAEKFNLICDPKEIF